MQLNFDHTSWLLNFLDLFLLNNLNNFLFLRFKRIPILFNQPFYFGVQPFTPFGEILKVIIVIGHLLECEILVKGLPQIKDLAVLPLILLQISPINNFQIGELRYSAHPHVTIAQLVADWVVFDV